MFRGIGGHLSAKSKSHVILYGSGSASKAGVIKKIGEIPLKQGQQILENAKKMEQIQSKMDGGPVVPGNSRGVATVLDKYSSTWRSVAAKMAWKECIIG